MNPKALLDALLVSSTKAEAARALEAFEAANGERVSWKPFGGKENNRGPIEVSADPGRSLVERLTNGIDAVLEAEHDRHRGVPDCRSPRDAAVAWLGISERGLSDMTPAQRQAIAKRVSVKLSDGDSKEARIVEVRDLGTGLSPEEMPDTILSLNESNKIRKHYLAGTYGQGGSSTFAISDCTLIASKRGDNLQVGFTVVRFLDLPAEDYKTGHYVYLTFNGNVLTADLPPSAFPQGTMVKHFGYDLSIYPSPLGPNSVYGLLNQVLFDPVIPIWLNSEVHGYRRVIKGSRNALNGAIDEGDENRRGPTLDHNVPMFYASLGDFGNIGIEYWVLERPSQSNKRPSAAFVNPSRPIILTLNGQNHAELPQSIVRKETELPYLAQRLVVHINCDSLTPTAKRTLFASSREDARRGAVLQLIHMELVRILKSDDELTRLNNEAREQGMRERDETALQEMRREVARLLRLQGIAVGQATGTQAGGTDQPTGPPAPPRPPRPHPEPIEVHEPPTYIRIVWEENKAIGFYPGQRRYVRLETDANSNYHNPDNPTMSRLNLIVHEPAVLKGSTPLRGGRMRVILDVASNREVGSHGSLRVELSRPGLTVLSDQREIEVQEAPPDRPADQQVSLPPFDIRPVSPENAQWTTLGWPDDVSAVASSAVSENGTLVIYYSTAYPRYASPLARYEQRDPALAVSFTKRYEVWVAAHSLLYLQNQQATEASGQTPVNEEVAEEYERFERCRIGTLAALFAAREVELGGGASATEAES